MSESIERETWATRAGFVLAAVGSAVGLGNVWRFPFQVGQEGGAAFLLVYLLFVLIVGIPAILVEFVVGRNTKQSPVGALAEYGGGGWRYLGWLFVAIGFVILSYYSVVGGWVLRYAGASLTGSYADAPEEYFVGVASGLDALALHLVFMAVTVGIVALGVKRGIELGVKFMVPAIVVLVLGLAAYAATLPGVTEAYAYYLSPDLGLLASEWTSILPAAAGQAFFTLSLGMGVMITYSSYVSEDRNLGKDAGAIFVLDTGIAFTVGLVVFPILFAAGVDPADPGAGALFISLAGAFGELPLGGVLGFVFFATVAIAALSSAISLLEVVVSHLIDEYGVERKKATLAVGSAVFLLGVPVTVDVVIVDLYDILAAQILLVLGGLGLAVLVGWMKPEESIEELSQGVVHLDSLGPTWIWLVRVPVVIVLAVALYLGVADYVEFLTTDLAEFLSG
ncbi:MAG: sodium-dependent transporter [Halobacteriales archaeon]